MAGTRWGQARCLSGMEPLPSSWGMVAPRQDLGFGPGLVPNEAPKAGPASLSGRGRVTRTFTVWLEAGPLHPVCHSCHGAHAPPCPGPPRPSCGWSCHQASCTELSAASGDFPPGRCFVFPIGVRVCTQRFAARLGRCHPMTMSRHGNNARIVTASPGSEGEM